MAAERAGLSVSVLVPSYRRPEDLGRCLEGLAAQTRPPDEVLVVVREGDTATWEALDGAPEEVPVRGFAVSEPGVVFALNSAFDTAQSDLVAITDDDAVPRPDWLQRIEAALGADRRLGAVGGRDVVHDEAGSGVGAEPVVGVIRPYGRVVGNHHLGVGGPRRVELLKGVNMAFRREALAGVRIDDRLRGGGAQPHWEIDLCLAVAAGGWELLYDPEIVVDHYPAQRFDEDQRAGRPVGALANEVYNETHALLARLPRRRAAVAVVYGLVVGTRQAPGLVTALEQRARGRPALERLRSTTSARLEALRDRGWLRVPSRTV